MRVTCLACRWKGTGIGLDRNPVQQQANRSRLQFQTSCSVRDYAMSRSASGTYLDHLTINATGIIRLTRDWSLLRSVATGPYERAMTAFWIQSVT